MTVPLIAHVIHRLDVGGMENGLVNLINRMPADRYRHAVISLTDITRFRDRIERDDVECHALEKKPGHDWSLYVRLWQLFRRLRPAIVHTRNLGSLEAMIPAALAGVAHRVHGEHGRDLQDIDGTKRKYQWLRRGLAPLVHRFVALSGELQSYLVDTVGVDPSKIVRIVNGVDLERFHPGARDRGARDTVVIGTVTRMQEVKDPLTLARAYAKLSATLEGRVRLVMVGDGPLMARVTEVLRGSDAWLAGNRDDVPELLRSFDVFSLSSRVEGISNTILEAMASGLPVVATRVGGNEELVQEGITGTLVPPGSPEALADALARYVEDRELIESQGRAARERAEREFELGGMIAKYTAVYDELLVRTPAPIEEETSTTCAG